MHDFLSLLPVFNMYVYVYFLICKIGKIYIKFNSE